MSRLIDADALFETLVTGDIRETQQFCYPCKKVLEAIDAQPTVEPQRIKGRWELLPGRDDEHIRYLHCSVCHFNGDYESNFCPNCGVDMRGYTDEV